MITAKADILFEVSWEVCNKVGGIFTVLKSKISCIMDYYKNYYLIGPYFKEKAELLFKEVQPPAEFQNVFDELKAMGIHCKFGKWLSKSEPYVVLIDCKDFYKNKNQIKTELWNNYQIDSLRSGWEFDEPTVWAYAAGIFLEKMAKVYYDKKIVAHFHEWLSGAGLLYLKQRNSHIKTVFQTHATILGRTISAQEDLFKRLYIIDPRQEAYSHNIQDKFLLEKASAQNADVFTTVSEITSIEAEKILGRTPEVLLLNGLDVSRFPTIEETSVKHVHAREKIREFLTFMFFPYYIFPLEHNLSFFILGRYEFRNKGIDVLIKALGRLNEQLQKEKAIRTISVFFWIPMANNGIKLEMLENKNLYRHIRNYVDWNSREILKKIVYDFISHKEPEVENIYTKEFLEGIRKDILHFKRKGNPPICTHNIPNPDQDLIISSLLKEGLNNKPDDKVKVIVHPVYLDGNDGLLNLGLYDAIAGCHLGVFPSYYEPWGYTPVETMAMGVPAVTTDMAGFGRYIEKQAMIMSGVYILKRHDVPEEEVINDLYEILYKFAKLDHSERVQNKINAKNLSNFADWKHLIKRYIEAHNLALKK
jgi:glycogen(starch) synthase